MPFVKEYFQAVYHISAVEAISLWQKAAEEKNCGD
jgi:hypothetical protein